MDGSTASTGGALPLRTGSHSSTKGSTSREKVRLHWLRAAQAFRRWLRAAWTWGRTQGKLGPIPVRSGALSLSISATISPRTILLPCTCAAGRVREPAPGGEASPAAAAPAPGGSPVCGPWTQCRAECGQRRSWTRRAVTRERQLGGWSRRAHPTPHSAAAAAFPRAESGNRRLEWQTKAAGSGSCPRARPCSGRAAGRGRAAAAAPPCASAPPRPPLAPPPRAGPPLRPACGRTARAGPAWRHECCEPEVRLNAYASEAVADCVSPSGTNGAYACTGRVGASSACTVHSGWPGQRRSPGSRTRKAAKWWWMRPSSYSHTSQRAGWGSARQRSAPGSPTRESASARPPSGPHGPLARLAAAASAGIETSARVREQRSWRRALAATGRERTSPIRVALPAYCAHPAANSASASARTLDKARSAGGGTGRAGQRD